MICPGGDTRSGGSADLTGVPELAGSLLCFVREEQAPVPLWGQIPRLAARDQRASGTAILLMENSDALLRGVCDLWGFTSLAFPTQDPV